MMRVARRRCETCPFRGASAEFKYESAVVEPEAWPCHTEHISGWGDTQCRGHWAARLKHPPTAEESAGLAVWRERFNVAFARSVKEGAPIEDVPLEPKRAELASFLVQE